jgi:hypothetical protein
MIRNEDELKIVREQLARAESALEVIRREVFPTNPRMYAVMAEPYADTIQELRLLIDAYFELASIQVADLEIALQGERVGLGKTSAAVITRFTDTFRRGLQSAVELVESINRSDTGRRRERWVESICDLPFVGVAPGSVRILLGEPIDQTLFSHENRESLHKALDLIFQGLEWADLDSMQSENHPFTQLPRETQQSLLALLTQLLPPRSGDVTSVAFKRRKSAADESAPVAATLTRDSRTRIRDAIQQLVSDFEFVELSGVIRSVDLDADTFVLRDRPDSEPDLDCQYGPNLEEAVKEYLDCLVIVSGTLETSRKGKSTLSADSIELVQLEKPSEEAHPDAQ